MTQVVMLSSAECLSIYSVLIWIAVVFRWFKFTLFKFTLLMGWEVKNLLSCQSKHGLVGSSAKTRNFLSREWQE